MRRNIIPADTAETLTNVRIKTRAGSHEKHIMPLILFNSNIIANHDQGEMDFIEPSFKASNPIRQPHATWYRVGLFHTVCADTVKARFPISFCVSGTTTHGAEEDLSDVMLWCGCSKEHRSGQLSSCGDGTPRQGCETTRPTAGRCA